MKDAMRLSALIILAVLICTTCIPAVYADMDDTQKKWARDHTVKVRSTVILTYENDCLEITEIYSGKDLKKKTGMENIVKTKVLPLETGEFKDKNGKDKMLVTKDKVILEKEGKEILKLEKGEKKVFKKEKEVILTTARDPDPAEIDMPQWTWSKAACWFGVCWYEREDPINLIWKNTYKDEVKGDFPDDWTDYPYESTQYVFINGKPDEADGIADDRYRFFGGYHARLWKLDDNTVIGNAHHDDAVFNYPIGHQVDEYEEAEEKVSKFYEDDWRINKKGYWLDNEYWNSLNAYNNGEATLIIN